MPEAEINGTTLYYERVGSGVPCIVLHGGLGLDHTYLKKTLGPLEDSLELTYIDHRGNGRSGRPPLETITMQQLADDVDGIRALLGLDHVALAGHSYGGFVALEYAVTRPDTVSHLVLIDTSPGAFEPTDSELEERPDPKSVSPAALAAASSTSSDLASDEEMLAWLPQVLPAYLHSAEPEEVAAVLSDTIVDAKTLARSMEVLGDWSVTDRLAVINCPTLVLCGRYDLFTTPECSRHLADAILGAELVWFENSGHFPWLEEPDRFFAATKDFFERYP